MLRSELIAKIADQNGDLDANVAEHIVTVLFNEIVLSLARGSRVELRGFGSFETRARTGRVARNPRNASLVEVPAKRHVHFKTGKILRERINAD
jgi:integration host factor subunit beta